ncbi:hypothetical protein Rsub_05691 [Raphidocelis subcapitata]|uniref:Uncharacterized protein n=1 Tax=Raphidocelis subcapitata TaxID=307507 RepID=A0A2V0P5E9_9CHLO|nr:hypothetical protein Rsub_05691 [Raphidocelis subcapitata]|eukprot:GBF93080.1 hypothetical protein Rsub_05691 [Raphidocelis subcapitata]
MPQGGAAAAAAAAAQPPGQPQPQPQREQDGGAAVAAAAPDLSQALPEAVLRAVAARLPLLDAAALAGTCRRMRAVVDGLHSEQGGGSFRSSRGWPCAEGSSERGGGGGGGVSAALRRRSWLAAAADSGSWRWPLLPAVRQPQGGGQEGERRGGRQGLGGRGPVLPPVEHASFFTVPPAVVAGTIAIVTDGHATAFLGAPSAAHSQQKQEQGQEQGQQQQELQQQQQGRQQQGQQQQQEQQHRQQQQQRRQSDQQAPAEDDRLLIGHFPPLGARDPPASPAWLLPGRRWPRLRHILDLPPPPAHATADALAAWPPRLAGRLRHARWLDPGSPLSALAAPVGGGDADAGAARRTLAAALETLAAGRARGGGARRRGDPRGGGGGGDDDSSDDDGGDGDGGDAGAVRLQLLDAAGCGISDQEVAAFIHPGLVALNAEATGAGGLTFMLLGAPASPAPAAAGPPDGGAAACPAAAPGPSSPPPQQQPPPPQQQQQQPLPPPPRAQAQPWALRALDLSRCLSLSAAREHAAYRLFQAALGRLECLEDLALRSCNVDAALPAHRLPPGAPPPPWAAAVSRLRALDACDAAALSPRCLAALLRLGRALRRLELTGCRSLAAGAAGPGASGSLRSLLLASLPPTPQQQSQQPAANCAAADAAVPGPAVPPEGPPPAAGLPSLHALAAGWGFSCGAAAAMVDASPFLTRLELGLGAEARDGLLARASERCPHLQIVSLRLAAAGTEGVAAVLSGCPKLRVLRLQHCSGALDGGAIAAAAERQAHRWQLEELQLVGGGAASLTDGDLLRLLQIQPPPTAAAPAAAAAAGSASAARAVGSAAGPAARIPRAPRAPLRLHTLAVVNARGLTDALLLRLAAAAAQLPLRHLRLEECFAPAKGRGAAGLIVGSGGGSGGGGSGGGGGEGCADGSGGAQSPAFTEGALLRLLARCPGLLSLRLRHAAAPLGAGFVAAAAEACPLLARVLLDQCDLAGGGFQLAADAYSSLGVVQVVKCAAFSADGEPLRHHHHHSRHGHHGHNGHHGHAPAEAAAAEGPGGAAAAAPVGVGADAAPAARRVAAALLTHRLHEGQTASTPLR